MYVTLQESFPSHLKKSWKCTTRELILILLTQREFQLFELVNLRHFICTKSLWGRSVSLIYKAEYYKQLHKLSWRTNSFEIVNIKFICFGSYFVLMVTGSVVTLPVLCILMPYSMSMNISLRVDFLFLWQIWV